MRSSGMGAFLAAIARYVGGHRGAPTGRAAKSPELQQELIAAAKAKRERRAAKRAGGV
jgi:hypothetical protein